MQTTMRTKSILEVLIVIIFLSACSPVTPVSVTQAIPVETLAVTNTSLPTPIPPATSLAANWDSAKRCVIEYPQQPLENQVEGVAVLRSLSSTVIGLELLLLDLKNGTSRVIDTANQSVWDVEVSTDRRTTAYSWFNNDTSKWELVLIDSTGNFQDVAWSSNKDFGFQGWLNDQQLMIVQDSKYIVINPYQDSQVSFSPLDFPNFSSDSMDFYVTFDPSLSRAIYRGGKNIILDMDTNSIIARIKDGYDRSPIVSWRPSGEQAAIVSSIPAEQNLHGLPDEIFILEKDGQVRQLTHLYDAFGLPLTIDSLSWSPDGSKIAFWLHDKEANTTLMVTDFATGNTENYCILNVLGTAYPISVAAPVWSPDGKYLMVESRYATDKNKVLVVDLSHNSAFPIMENASPVGWMSEIQ